MILVDTSVWVDHLRQGNARLELALDAGEVLMHPFVIGELACGSIPRRAQVLTLLEALPAAVVATQREVLTFIDRHRLMSRGVGFIDAHLLAATALTDAARLWTLDRRLAAAATALRLAWSGAAR